MSMPSQHNNGRNTTFGGYDTQDNDEDTHTNK